jgi:type IV fimbrial biogenesis protein FimT
VLEEVMPRLQSARGFTMVELMITLVVGAVLVSLAAPSFKGYFVKKKVEGTAAELANDIQFARAEAVARNQPVRLSFGNNCYVVHMDVPTPSTANSACAVTGGTTLRRVAVEDTAAVALAASSPLTNLLFDTVRGEATLGGMASTANEASVNVQTATALSPAYRLRAVVSKYGRVQLCTSNAVPGYNPCS